MVKRFALRVLASAALVGCILSCASTTMLDLTEEEQGSMSLAAATPLSFSIPRDRGPEAWDRAQTFVDRYSSMKLRSSTDSMIQSYDPPPAPQLPGMEVSAPIRFGYSVSRAAMADSIRLDVRCVTNRQLAEKDADTNAHIAAYFILTGRIACARCIVR